MFHQMFSLVLLFVSCQVVLDGQVTESRRTGQEPVAKRYVPWIEVSLVTVDPPEIHLTGKANQSTATITVQIFHQNLASEQTVELEVGTYKSDPPGVSVTYEPSMQTIHLPSGNSGAVAATVKASK